MTDSGGPPPPGARKREGIKSLGLHNELGLSDSRSVMSKSVSESDWFMVQHASHTFGGRRIESPQGGTTAAPPFLEDLGLMSRGLRRSDRDRWRLAWQALGKLGTFWTEVTRTMLPPMTWAEFFVQMFGKNYCGRTCCRLCQNILSTDIISEHVAFVMLCFLSLLGKLIGV